MKKILVFVIVGCLFFVGRGICEESKMNGWGKVKWGMTETEVKKAEPNIEISDKGKSKDDDKDYYFPLTLKNVKIAGKDFAAQFRFAKNSKKLEAVALNPSGKTDSELFDSVSNLLISKYGKPTKMENNRQMGTQTQTWIIGKTKIVLLNLSGMTTNVLYEALSSGNDNL